MANMMSLPMIALCVACLGFTIWASSKWDINIGVLALSLQFSGKFDGMNIELGNVKETPLKDILNNSRYLNMVCTTVKEVRDHSEKCKACPYFKYCTGGCRAMSFAFFEDYLREDPFKCLFFSKGYYQKIENIMEGYENLTKINREISQ